MQTMEQALAELVEKTVIAKEEATLKTSHPQRLEELLHVRTSKV
jgi:Tfp pilus assembly pilus retraction ATPase PilT